MRDVAEKAWTRLRDPKYRASMYEPAYRADVAKYGGELSVPDANMILAKMRVERSRPGPATIIDSYGSLSDTAQALYGETLPTLRYWFRYTGRSGIEYVIGGVPDGIAPAYCYEFKSPSGNDNGFKDNRRMAIRQAVLYAYAFQRPSIKVQLVRYQLPGPFPFKLRDLRLPQIIPLMERPLGAGEAEGILDRMDGAISGRTELATPTPALVTLDQWATRSGGKSGAVKMDRPGARTSRTKPSARRS